MANQQQFGKQAQKKIVDEVRYVSRKSRSEPAQRPRYPIGVGGGTVMEGFVTTAITARTGNPPSAITYGSGVITLYNADGSVGQTGVAVKNPYNNGVAINKMVQVIRAADGFFHPIGSDC